MEMLTGFMLVLSAVVFAYFGIRYTQKFYDQGWRPSITLHGLHGLRGLPGPSMVSRSEAVEDQPGWRAYADSLFDR